MFAERSNGGDRAPFFAKLSVLVIFCTKCVKGISKRMSVIAAARETHRDSLGSHTHHRKRQEKRMLGSKIGSANSDTRPGKIGQENSTLGVK